MKIFIGCSLVYLVTSSTGIAQDSTQIRQYEDALENKQFGVEFNPAFLVFGFTRSYLALSGGCSLFDVDRKAEIAFPIFFQRGPNSQSGYRLTIWKQDIIYRRFLGQHQDGFYLSAGFRYIYINGDNSFSLSSYPITMSKLGALFGIGYRYFTYSGFYWGVSVAYGTYFSNDNRPIDSVVNDNIKRIVDIEILKLGYSF